MHQSEETLLARQPFDFQETLRVARGFYAFAEEQQVDDIGLTRAFAVGDQAIGVRISEAAGGVLVRYTNDGPASADALEDVSQQVRQMLSLDDDLTPLYELAADDQVFSTVVQKVFGYHQVRFATPFECACWAILTQRTTGRGTWQMKHALTTTFGPVVHMEGKLYHAFPEPLTLLAAGEDAVGRAVRHAQKTPWIMAVAEAFAMIERHWLYDAPYVEVKQWLHGIEGFGPWSVAFILLRGLGRVETLPVADKGLVAAASHFYGLQTEASVRRLAAHYEGMQGYWAHYLRVAE